MDLTCSDYCYYGVLVVISYFPIVYLHLLIRILSGRIVSTSQLFIYLLIFTCILFFNLRYNLRPNYIFCCSSYFNFVLFLFVCFYTFLLSETTKCSGFILDFTCLSPGLLLALQEGLWTFTRERYLEITFYVLDMLIAACFYYLLVNRARIYRSAD